ERRRPRRGLRGVWPGASAYLRPPGHRRGGRPGQPARGQSSTNGTADYDPIAAIRTRASGQASGTARPAYFGARHGLLQTPILARAELTSAPRWGPLIVEEYDATCVVPPGCQ